MADGRIFITISNRPTSSSTGNGGDRQEQQPVKEKQSLLVHSAYNFVLNQSKQAITYAANNIGNFTGDYNAQRNTTELLGVATKAAGIAMSFAVNPIVGTFAALGTGISFAEQEYANWFAIKRNNYSIERLRDISGLNNYTNGSR